VEVVAMQPDVLRALSAPKVTLLTPVLLEVVAVAEVLDMYIVTAAGVVATMQAPVVATVVLVAVATIVPALAVAAGLVDIVAPVVPVALDQMVPVYMLLMVRPELAAAAAVAALSILYSMAAVVASVFTVRAALVLEELLAILVLAVAVAADQVVPLHRTATDWAALMAGAADLCSLEPVLVVAVEAWDT
jgi:hypothetical protein